MITRPKHLPISVMEHEKIKLAPNETPEAAYKAWSAKVAAAPRICKAHHHTQLVLCVKGNEILPVYDESWGYIEPMVKPGEFNFRATFMCPSCRIAYALFPPEFHETSFDTFDISTPERAYTHAKARELVAQVNQHGRGFAVFVGSAGPGKTRLAANIVRELEIHDTLYVRQGQLTLALRATYGRRAVDYDDDGEQIEQKSPLEITQNVRFLVLDEVGCAQLANDERLFFDELLKHRYDHHKPTILISNLPLDQLREFLGDAPTSRISLASGKGRFIVQFKGGDFRSTMGGSYLEGNA